MNHTARKLKLLSILEPKLNSSAQRFARTNRKVDAEDALQTGRLAILECLPRLNQDLPEEVQIAFLANTATWRMRDLAYDADGIHCPCSQRAERNVARHALATGCDIDFESRNRLGALLSLFESMDDYGKPEIGTSIVDLLESDLFVKMLLEKLPDEDASTFTLVFLCGFSYNETAQMLGISNAKLRSRLRAAKRVLKAEMLAA